MISGPLSLEKLQFESSVHLLISLCFFFGVNVFLTGSREMSTLDFFHDKSTFERKQICTLEILVKKSFLAMVRKAFVQFEN